MTIVQLIESMCGLVGDMAAIINRLSARLVENGILTEGEYAEIKEIRKRIDTIGISPPDDK